MGLLLLVWAGVRGEGEDDPERSVILWNEFQIQRREDRLHSHCINKKAQGSIDHQFHFHLNQELFSLFLLGDSGSVHPCGGWGRVGDLKRSVPKPKSQRSLMTSPSD